jgi:hypothetical protein
MSTKQRRPAGGREDAMVSTTLKIIAYVLLIIAAYLQ